VPQDREAARDRIAQAGLTQLAVERVARNAFRRMPITLVDRARSQLRRFFSDGPWTVEDDAGLSAIVGPGEGWNEEELEPGVRVSYGWRGGTFRVDIDAPALEPSPEELSPPIPVHARTLGDTFEEYMLIEPGRTPPELRFSIGPGANKGTGRFTRENQGTSAAVAALFREFDDIVEVWLEPGGVAVSVLNPERWNDIMLQVFDAVNAGFVPPRAKPPDRAYERAIAEMGAFDVATPRDLARVLDATTSPDAAYRRLAVAKLENADPIVVQRPWKRALEDSSRAVRRAAIRAMAHAARPDLRLMYERGLADKDACVRYYALRGLAHVGVGRAEDTVHRRSRDDDMRVRVAADAALENRIPQ
jgi:hypothetical protein